ncbi:phosphate propanoyltransferase [Clostridium sp. Cult2]|uniref:phosphate propanoyltransferase n=1 Tax=Clostridium sp. Cult2 TaxID=2079003 RepID=UPI001F2AE198|nr:phosphate propanoyltransferase [Clostridium sp. Cult2]MCF6466272.1 propanediol utilization protein [Clostridium sp. Cult2]
MKVITEEYLRTLFKKNIPKEYKINKKAIITPSARQYLKERDVKLLIEEGESTSINQIVKRDQIIPIEASGRHIHLSKKDIEILFGKNYEMLVNKELSQPGQFQYEEKVSLIGPKSIIKNVSILGPPRDKTQVEISRTDAINLGINAPIKESGDLDGTANIFVATEKAVIKVNESVIIAKRHIHMSPEDAIKFNVKNRDIVSVKINSNRPVIFQDVLVRVNKNYRLSMHIDYDEANAAGLEDGVMGVIVWI